MNEIRPSRQPTGNQGTDADWHGAFVVRTTVRYRGGHHAILVDQPNSAVCKILGRWFAPEREARREGNPRSSLAVTCNNRLHGILFVHSVTGGRLNREGKNFGCVRDVTCLVIPDMDGFNSVKQIVTDAVRDAEDR